MSESGFTKMVLPIRIDMHLIGYVIVNHVCYFGNTFYPPVPGLEIF